jgi:antitoxin HicB
VTCRDLPPLITQGDDLDDALHAASDGVAEVFAAYLKKNIPFPAEHSLWWQKPQSQS